MTKEEKSDYNKIYYKANKDNIKEYYKANKDKIREYYETNKEKKKEKSKEYYKANKEKLKEYYKANKDKISEQKKQYYEANKEKKRQYNNQYNEANKDKLKEYRKEYYKTNKDKIREYQKANKDKRNEKEIIKRKENPIFKMKCNLRSRTSKAFRTKGYSKNTKTQEMLGVDWEVCKAHIEKQFTKGMNWDNYGEWHIDHIIPLASANNEKELMKLCHYRNLQPLWAEDNLNKRDNIPNTQTYFKL